MKEGALIFLLLSCLLILGYTAVIVHDRDVLIIKAHQSAMLLMVDKYIEDTKDMPVTIRCKKVAKACNYSYLRTGR